MNWIAIAAIVGTGLLGFLGTKLWSKITSIAEIIRMIFAAVEDKILDKDEIEAIWNAIKAL